MDFLRPTGCDRGKIFGHLKKRKERAVKKCPNKKGGQRAEKKDHDPVITRAKFLLFLGDCYFFLLSQSTFMASHAIGHKSSPLLIAA
jgi:hypothetical protein